MITGDSKPILILLQTAAGAALSYANKAAFQGAGWDLTWYGASGVALTSQPTWSLVDLGVGIHQVTYVQPGGAYTAVATVPGTNAISPAGWQSEGQSYDEDSIAGLLLTSQGVPATITAADGTLSDVVANDSWTTGVQTIPLGYLTRFGLTYASLATGWTITAGIKQQPSDDTVDVPDCDFEVTADGTYTAGWDTMPTEIITWLGDERTVQVFMDVQITNGTLKITVGRWSFNAVWDRDET